MKPEGGMGTSFVAFAPRVRSMDADAAAERRRRRSARRARPKAREVLRCSFCGKKQREVATLIAGPGVYICDECVALCVEIIEDGSSEDSSEG